MPVTWAVADTAGEKEVAMAHRNARAATGWGTDDFATETPGLENNMGSTGFHGDKGLQTACHRLDKYLESKANAVVMIIIVIHRGGG